MTDHDVELCISEGLTDYAAALAAMEERAAAVRAGSAQELLWLIEHPPLFTAGTSADPAELFNPLGFPVHAAGRGGRYTYHGPGQRVVYVVLDLERRKKDVRCFVHALEGWMIATLAELGVAAHRSPGRVGIWIGEGAGDDKIGAIGVRVRRWVTMHGFAINVSPNLDHFAGIVPCGISDRGVTSLKRLGVAADMTALDKALLRGFPGFLKALGGPEQVA
ncbi:MAG TPA: lipoyl(octanoyl) transferase LipB [Sphingomicrobium sp.]|nr:lipoyl(octanoyl) transferase LipB [Sphingomicrobium sp.]